MRFVEKGFLIKKIKILHVVYCSVIVILAAFFAFLWFSYKSPVETAADSNGSLDANYAESENEKSVSQEISPENQSTSDFTKIVIDKFCEDTNTQLASDDSNKQSFNLLTNNSDWFSMSFTSRPVDGTALDFYCYNVDKSTGDFVALSDLFVDGSFSDVILKEIKKQIQVGQKSGVYKNYDINLINTIDGDHTFYINDKNNLVIVFQKYEITAGVNGCPEFVIPRLVIESVLKPEFKDKIS